MATAQRAVMRSYIRATSASIVVDSTRVGSCQFITCAFRLPQHIRTRWTFVGALLRTFNQSDVVQVDLVCFGMDDSSDTVMKKIMHAETDECTYTGDNYLMWWVENVDVGTSWYFCCRCRVYSIVILLGGHNSGHQRHQRHQQRNDCFVRVHCCSSVILCARSELLRDIARPFLECVRLCQRLI